MNTRARVVIQITSALFLIFSGLAMVFYHGGYPGMENASHYSLLHNFLSDLGVRKAYNLQPQHTSNVLFILSLIAASTSIWVFFSVFLNRIRPGYVTGIITSRVASVGLLVLACLPSDVFFWPHRLTVVIIFATLGSAFLALSRQIQGNGMALIGSLFILYVLYMIFGPRPEAGPIFREIHAIFQKTVVYLAFVFLMYTTATTRNHA